MGGGGKVNGKCLQLNFKISVVVKGKLEVSDLMEQCRVVPGCGVIENGLLPVRKE